VARQQAADKEVDQLGELFLVVGAADDGVVLIAEQQQHLIRPLLNARAVEIVSDQWLYCAVEELHGGLVQGRNQRLRELKEVANLRHFL
tara:strand:- start:53 stop:319 length:267 start_codon:yes stop_codon:yes gene_type:complete